MIFCLCLSFFRPRYYLFLDRLNRRMTCWLTNWRTTIELACRVTCQLDLLIHNWINHSNNYTDSQCEPVESEEVGGNVGSGAFKNKMFKSYKRFQSQGHVTKKKRLTVVASLILAAFLVVEIIQPWMFAFAGPLWPCIKVKVIEPSMSRYAMHKSTVMPRLGEIDLFVSLLNV